MARVPAQSLYRTASPSCPHKRPLFPNAHLYTDSAKTHTLLIGYPRYGENGTKYSCYLYGDEAQHVVDTHNFEAQPLFMYLPMHDTHSPYETTPEWLDPKVRRHVVLLGFR